ncbi:hypothetical protein SJAV_22570 [Sulfurisphaera javensis]|uniref:Uncharacterized protein n=1 Tax=Sulfurisphaera javensis TaxID=2049879 RepID=A0AAT9GTR3_9CREN
MQKRSVCPYYKGGFCTSPLLDNPSDTVTSPNRCFKDYRICRFYKDEEEKKDGLEVFISGEDTEEEVNFYPKINILEKILDSECSYFQIIKTEKGLVAYCKVLRRILTERQANLCSTQWKTCPFKNLT